MKHKGRTLALAIWLSVLLACALIITQTRFVADMSAFMPKAPTERQQLLVDQMRYGIIGRLIMIGIEGGDAAERARLSRELAASLRKTALFVGVQNGDDATQERDKTYFFENRYLLSPAVTPERFTVEGLHTAIGNSIDALSGNAGMLLKQLLPRDPTGEALQLLGQFTGDSQPETDHGVWASRSDQRVVLLAYTLAAGSDTEAQSKAIQTIRQIFDKIPARMTNTRLVMSGTGVFSVSSRNTIESEVSRLATASFALVVCLLLFVYRSFKLLALGMLPVVSGVLVGIAAVSLGFGQVHGLTLGFGTTLIGETVDYSIYFFIQRSNTSGTRSFWRTIWLGVFTSISGFATLLFSGFPGLTQLGLYSISGLIAAVLVTRYVLPVLKPQHVTLRDFTGAGIILDDIFKFSSRLRWLVAALMLAAGAGILLHSGPIWNRQLSALSPIPKAEQDLDMKLRNDLGAPDMRYMAALTAPDEETALYDAEQVGTVLQELIQSKTIGGFKSPSLVLPSTALQHARQAAIPDAAQMHLRLQHALEGMPIDIGRLNGFLADAQAARSRQPLTRADLNGTSSALLLDSLLVKRDNDYLALMPLSSTAGSAEIDINKVNAALRSQGQSNVVVIDLLEESTSLFDNYRHEVLTLSGLSCLAIFALLLASLRSLSRTLRIIVPLVCAVLCVTEAILLSGTQLTILHLVGLLLVVAIGSNYALFFESDSQTRSKEERRQTQVSLLIANLTTVGSFGLLALSQIPVLSAIGSTVAPGAFLALIFSAILTRKNADVQIVKPHG